MQVHVHVASNLLIYSKEQMNNANTIKKQQDVIMTVIGTSSLPP